MKSQSIAYLLNESEHIYWILNLGNEMHSIWDLWRSDLKGPLHTRAKSRDLVIVRAQKKVFKGRPKTLPKSSSVIMDPQV
jgi:hypothetical protein